MRYFYLIQVYVRKVFYYIINYLNFKLWGVQFTSFSSDGLVNIFMSKGSSISIGKNLRVNASRNSNFAGFSSGVKLSTLSNNAEIVIGNNVGLSGTVIAASNRVEINDNVKLGLNVSIFDNDFHPDDSRSGTPEKVLISKNVWVGSGTLILKGVTIGENAIVGANSIVTHDLPANSMSAGCPARLIRMNYE